MKLVLTCYVVASLYLRVIKCQRFTAEEMLTALQTISTATKFHETEECLPTIKGERYPDAEYHFIACDTNQDIVSLRNFPNQTQCSGFQCWESQLTDSSRFDILDLMNKYRLSVAVGKCGPRCDKNKHKIVFELRWCNILENLAIDLISNCENQKNSSLSDFIRYNNESGRIDYVAVSFQVKEGLQQELRLILRILMTENYLNDWDEKSKQFRRGLAIDVGCAYVLRHGVSVITSLNETVYSGNVGHLCCVFGSAKSSITLVNENPSSSTCSRALPGFTTELSSKNSLYHSLCKVIFPLDLIKIPSVSCQFDEKVHGKIFNGICPEGSSQNYVTWSERHYGLFLKFRTERNKESNEVTSVLQDVECNLPIFPKVKQREEEPKHNYDCAYKQKVVNEVNPSSCRGWFCTESQLSDDARLLIWHYLNRARNHVAQGKCSSLCKPPCQCNKVQYCNMVELRWHWFLELQAAEKVKTCPSENSYQKVSYFNTPFPEPVFFEQVTLVFDLPPEGQIRLGEKFTKFFWTNELSDWAPDGSFRRGNAMWIGCAIIVRPFENIANMRPHLKIRNGLATHMVCIYASLYEEFGSKKGSANINCCPNCTESPAVASCHFKLAKNLPLHPYLCSFTPSLKSTMNCAVHKCNTSSAIPPGLKSRSSWNTKIGGYTLTQYSNGSFEYTYRLSVEEELVRMYMNKICKVGTASFCLVAFLMLFVISLLYRLNAERKYFAKLKMMQK